MPVTNSVREARLRAGLTQEELSRLCGVSRQTIVTLERGLHEPSIGLVLRIAAELNTSVDALFRLEPSPGG